MLSQQEIEKIAKLSRIALTDEEKRRFAAELSSVIDYFKQLQKLDTSGVDLHLAETETTNRTRSDEPAAADIQEKIFANVPARQDAFIKVKSVL